MQAACLIPSTRPHTLPRAVKSARDDGWHVLVIEDTEREGVCLTRNRLLQQAFDAGYDIVRYLDDDDIILPHLERILPFFEAGSDVVYTDYRLLKDGISKPKVMFANPATCVTSLPVDCCGWIATTESLRKVETIYDQLWPPFPLTEGYHVFLQMFKTGLRIDYCPVKAFEYCYGDDGLHTQPNGELWIARYWAEVENLKHTSPHLFE